MNIYVGNLSYEMTEDDLKGLFEAFGQVSSSSVIRDKFSGQSKGFGFVEMPTDAEGKAAIGGLNGKEIKGRTISVDEARPRAGGGGGGGATETGAGGLGGVLVIAVVADGGGACAKSMLTSGAIATTGGGLKSGGGGGGGRSSLSSSVVTTVCRLPRRSWMVALASPCASAQMNTT